MRPNGKKSSPKCIACCEKKNVVHIVITVEKRKCVCMFNVPRVGAGRVGHEALLASILCPNPYVGGSTFTFSLSTSYIVTT